MPTPVYPTEVVTTYMNNNIEGTQQPTTEELTREIEEAADLLVGGFDRDGDKEIRGAIQSTFWIQREILDKFRDSFKDIFSTRKQLSYSQLHNLYVCSTG